MGPARPLPRNCCGDGEGRRARCLGGCARRRKVASRRVASTPAGGQSVCPEACVYRHSSHPGAVERLTRFRGRPRNPICSVKLYHMHPRAVPSMTLSVRSAHRSEDGLSIRRRASTVISRRRGLNVRIAPLIIGRLQASGCGPIKWRISHMRSAHPARLPQVNPPPTWLHNGWTRGATRRSRERKIPKNSLTQRRRAAEKAPPFLRGSASLRETDLFD